MGKGDQRTKRGKLNRGSFGVTRPSAKKIRAKKEEAKKAAAKKKK